MMVTARANAWPRIQRGVAGVATFVGSWQLILSAGVANPYYLPAPATILMVLGRQATSGTFWAALGDTLITWAIGLVLASIVGGTLGLAIGAIRPLREFVSSTVEFLRPIPSVALIPLVVMLQGTGRAATVTLVTYASLWQILVQLSYGVQDVDPVARDTAAIYHFSRLSVVRFVIWPTALPYALTGFRLAAAVALMLTVSGELLIGTPGLGRIVVTAQSAGDFPLMYATIVVVGVLGVVINLLARAADRRFLSWHPSNRLQAV
jgi:ABC-type nitrate/sulfonate/bicarbonate transport system permease component